MRLTVADRPPSAFAPAYAFRLGKILPTVMLPLAAFARNTAGGAVGKCAGGGTTLLRPFPKAAQDQGPLIYGTV
jgi:hypothetical protein